jgi:hypothetical protein
MDLIHSRSTMASAVAKKSGGQLQVAAGSKSDREPVATQSVMTNYRAAIFGLLQRCDGRVHPA